MAYKITYTARFQKNLNKLTKVELKQLKNKLIILVENPFHPSLRTKKVKGTEYFECSVNMDVCIIWFYEQEEMIVLIDVGHHDIFKQY